MPAPDETTPGVELQLEAQMDASQASPDRLLGLGAHAIRRYRSQPVYQERLVALTETVTAVVAGSLPSTKLYEAMGSADFPLLFGDVLDRMLLGFYNDAPSTWRQFARVARVRDFRTVKRFRVDGAEGVLPRVLPQGEYKLATLTEGKYEYAVLKYGRKLGFDFESWINDDLDILTDIPRRHARAANRSERKFVTALYADTNGPHASFYTAGSKNLITIANGAPLDNPVLGIPGLQAAITLLSKQRDADGEPIAIDMVHLVVPPALEITAQNILNAIQLIVGADSAAERLVTNNWMKNRVQLHVEPYLPVISTTNGNTSWYLFADPNGSMPALEVGFLRGYEAPTISMKAPNTVVLSGADAMPMDFDTETLEYKVRHIFGGQRMDPKMTVASKGTAAP